MALTPEQYDRAQPKFSPSHVPVPGQRGDGLMIEAEGIQPAQIPGQRVVGSLRDPDNPGHRVQCSVPHQPFERWIDDAGNVYPGVIRTTRVMKKNGKSADDGNYGTKMERERLKAGHVRYDDGLGHPASFVDTDGKKVAIQEWTPAIRDAFVASRQKAQAQEMLAERRAWADKKEFEGMEIAKAMTKAFETMRTDGAADREKRAAKRAELEK